MIQFTKAGWYNYKIGIYEDKCAIFEHFNDKLNDETLEELKDYKKVIFDCRFNQPIDNLPNNIEYIEFNNLSEKYESKATDFNQSVDNLPSNLKTLVLRVNKFDYTLDLLPESLEILYFECVETICVDGGVYDPETGMKRIYFDNLPINLKKIIIDIGNFNSPLDNLPDSLENLTLISTLNLSKLDNLPKKLKELTINGSYFNDLNNLPDSLEVLKLKRIDMNIHYKKMILSVNNLPKNLKKIKLVESDVSIIKLSGMNVDITDETKSTQFKIDSKYGTEIDVIIKNP